jgi:nicotinate-nucleotide adenylyltransferase
MSGGREASTAAPELALLGGSFDPPHVGHLFLAAYALSTSDVERVLVLPVYQHAFGKPLSPFEQRLEMCRLAFRDLRRVEVSELERELGGVSRTLRLIEAVAARHPGHRLRTLVGADILAEQARWQHFDEITRRAPLLVAGRAGHGPAAGGAGPLLPAVSSTEIRAQMARGEEPLGLLPKAVWRYARAHGLYAAGSAP